MKYIPEPEAEKINVLLGFSRYAVYSVLKSSFLLNGSGTAAFAFRRKLFYFPKGEE